MTTLLVVHGGGDPTAALLLRSAERLGWKAVEADLRSDRFSLGVAATTVVRLRGRPISPHLVVDRSATTGLGLSGPDALRRQRGTAWRERHTAAREEQALLLAALDQLARGGAVVANPSTAADLALMPNAIVERLARTDVPVRRAGEPDGVEVLVAGGRGVAYRHHGELAGPTPTNAHLRDAAEVATAAGATLLSVSFTDRGGRRVVTGWDVLPDLTSWPEPEQCALGALLGLVEVDAPVLVDAPPPFFVEELGRPTDE
ncbi:MAG: hypothetical protein AAGF02_20660 [Actinomycetota bacterium]